MFSFFLFFKEISLFYYGQHAGRAANSWAQTLLTPVTPMNWGMGQCKFGGGGLF